MTCRGTQTSRDAPRPDADHADSAIDSATAASPPLHDAGRPRRSLASPHPVQGDGVLLEQVMFNLIRNGIDASAGLPAARRTIDVSTRRLEASLLVSVSDRGTGIAPDVAPKLFESFFTTKETGMSLGLGICRTIIESHQGRLWHEHRAGGGTVFSFSLPL